MQAQNLLLNRVVERPPRLDGKPYLVVRAKLPLPPILTAHRLILHAGGESFAQQRLADALGCLAVGRGREHHA